MLFCCGSVCVAVMLLLFVDAVNDGEDAACCDGVSIVLRESVCFVTVMVNVLLFCNGLCCKFVAVRVAVGLWSVLLYADGKCIVL